MKSLYAGSPKNPPATCRHHHCSLTVKEMKKHECLRKQCVYLQKHEHTYWEQRELMKQRKKASRAEFAAKINQYCAAGAERK